MATIKDVARHAGVAISTASAALNRSAPVSDDVIARVEEAVKALGYIPHGAAQSLRSGHSRLIGLIVPNISNPHFAAMARIIENTCLSAGYLSMAFSTGQDSVRENQILKMLRQQRVAGLIIIPSRSDAEHGRQLKPQLHVPTVFLDMKVEGLENDAIKLDNLAATRSATRHLIELGHRRIGVLTGIAGLATSDDRLAGYVEAHRATGLEVDPALLLRGEYDHDISKLSTTEALQGTNPPTALLSLGNMMTMGAMHAMRELGLGVPDDVSLIGLDDFDFADLIDPPLTVIRSPIADMASRAISVLLETISSKRTPSGRVHLYQAELLLRESCRRIS